MKRALAAAIFSLCSTAALAQVAAWPTKPVRFVVPFAPAGPTDILARMIAQRLDDVWRQSIIVDNRAGAGGNIGVQAAAKAPADGYTVLVTTTSIAVNASLTPNPGYDVGKDFVPVIDAASSPNMIVVHESGARSLKELIESSRKDGIIYGSAGTGTTPHLSAEYLFKNLAGLKTMHVPYKGAGPAVNAALANEVPAVCVAMPTAVSAIKSGRLRGLAVTSRRRVAALPDVPTVEEAGFPGFEDDTWIGLFVPAGTSPAIVNKINVDVNAFLALPETRDRLAALGFEPVGGTPEAFAAYLKTEVAKWARVVKETGAKVE
ncbi:MAG: tripartite tricarboxylate transporter substrate binding protein [Clostridia bacterium]